MDIEKYCKVSSLEQEGKKTEAFDLLCSLADQEHPLALFELSNRYISTKDCSPEPLSIDPDIEKSKALAKTGKKVLEQLAKNEDGEAMRMLAYMYFGFLGPYYKNISAAEKWLLKSIDAGCHIASNDLATYYQSRDIEKAKYWYRYAEEHDCRAVHNPNLET